MRSFFKVIYVESFFFLFKEIKMDKIQRKQKGEKTTLFLDTRLEIKRKRFKKNGMCELIIAPYSAKVDQIQS